MRKFPVHHHAVLAHPEEPRQVLQFDRAGRLAVAAGRARPQRVLADDAADERRQRVVGRFVGDDVRALFHQMVLDAVVHPFLRQRLAREERRAGILAPAALGAGERVQPLLPREVAGCGHAQADLRGVRVVGEQLFQVDRRHPVGGAAAAEIQRGQRGDDVEVLAQRQDDQEREHEEQLCPVRQGIAGALRFRRQRRQRVTQPASGERKGALVGDPGIRSGEEREAEAVEQEIGDHDRGDQRQDQQRLAIGLEPGGLRT